MPTIPPAVFSEDDAFLAFLALLKRRLPVLFVQRWDGLTGQGAMRAIARVFSELLRFVQSMTGNVLLREATGAVKAEGQITIAYDDETVQPYTIKAGSRIAQTTWGVGYVLAEDIVRAAGDPAGEALPIQVEAEWSGEWGNVPEDMVRQWGIANPSDALSLEWDPGTPAAGKSEFLDGVQNGRIAIVRSTRMEGGRLAALDLRARGRGLPRVDGEDDPTLRARVRTIGRDAVTPNGILRAFNRALGYDGATLEEGWLDGFAIGYGAIGYDWIGKGRFVLVLVPDGSDIDAYQALGERVRAAGIHLLVLPQAVG